MVSKTDEKIGQIIDLLFDLREEKAKLNDEIKKINARVEKGQKMLIESLEAQGLDKARGSKATASIAPQLVPNVDDKVAMAKWAYENDRFDILQSRVAPAPVREMFALENKLPDGISLFTKTVVSITKKRGA